MTNKERKREKIAGWKKQTKNIQKHLNVLPKFEIKPVAKTSARLATLKRNNRNRQR